MDLSVPYSKSSNAKEAYDSAVAQITPEYIAKFKIKADIHYSDGQSISATGKGFTLTLYFNESETNVEIKLSLILRAFKGNVLDAVEKKLKQHT